MSTPAKVLPPPETPKPERVQSKLVLDGVPPPRRWWKKALIFIGFSGLVGATAACVVGFVLYFKYSDGLPDIPKVDEYWPPILSEIYTDDAVLAGEFYNERRKVVPYDHIPKRLVQAFIASEDQNFFDHGGIDYLGTGRAAMKTLLKKASGQGSVQGGSTLTQQTAKAVLVSNELSFLDSEEMRAEAERRVPRVGEPAPEVLNAEFEAVRKARAADRVGKPPTEGQPTDADLRDEVHARLVKKAEADRRAAVNAAYTKVREERTRAAFEKATAKKLSRKIREAILARRLESALTKEEILYLYLNNVYLGHHSYGVQSAAENYYRKDVRDLTLAEMALVAGLPQAPSRYSPFKNPAAAKKRRSYVLRRMLDEGMISKREHDEANVAEVQVYPVEDVFHDFAPYFTEEVRKSTVEKFGNQVMLNEGLKVFTTMDSERQRAAQESVLTGLLAVDKRQGFRGPLMQLAKPDERAAFVEKSQKVMGDEKIENGRFYVGLVAAIDKDDTAADIKVGTQVGKLPLLGMRWARKLNAEQYYPSVVINAVSAALKVGDVVVVRAVADKKDLYDDKESYSVAAERAVPEGVQLFRLEQEPELQSAVVSIDPHRQYLVAMVGGYDFDANEYNRAFQACRQPGSGYKPIEYSAAIEQLKWTAATMIVDSPIVYDDPENQNRWKPANYSEEFVGEVLVRTALINSMNIPAVKTFIAVGIKKMAAWAKLLGLNTPMNEDFSSALGSSCVIPYELTQVYSMFDRLGLKKPTYFVRKVEDRFGRTVEDHTSFDDPWSALKDRVAAGYARLYEPGEQVMAPETAYIMVDLMRGVVREGTGGPAQRLGKPAAGKTGTTNDSFDAWFNGFTRDLVTSAWVGYDLNPHPLGKYETGGRAALPIWLAYMKRALEGRDQPEFSPPGSLDLVRLRIDTKTGKLASSGTKNSADMYFKRGTEPRDAEPEKGQVDPGKFMMEP
jgi:penicillin-binding protein 1A